jgi:hypothetical protein
MSLINDALKRTKQAQQEQKLPSFRAAPLHVAPATRSSRHWHVALGAWALAVIVAGMAVWLYPIKHQPVTDEAKVGFTPLAGVEKSPAVGDTAQSVVQTSMEKSPLVTGATASPKEGSTPATEAKAAPASESQPSKADFPYLRLQGVIYNPDEPVAIINGRSLNVGSTISGVTVVAIARNKVTVTWNGMTNVLGINY